MKRIYLAGPDVFFHAAALHFDDLEARCAAVGLRGVRPSDGGLGALAAADVPDPEVIAERIYQANLELIRGCDALVANLMPFRNALEPDSGTVFELGVAVALGKPVAGFLAGCERRYEDKVIEQCGASREPGGPAWDEVYGYLVEEFGQPLNLMLSRSTPLFETIDEALEHLAALLGAGPPEPI